MAKNVTATITDKTLKTKPSAKKPTAKKAAATVGTPAKKKTTATVKPAATRKKAPVKIKKQTPVEVIAQAMLDKKAREVASLDLSAVGTAICDYFVVADANAATQVVAIADHVEKEVYERLHEAPRRVQGKENAFWIILDYIDVVVHIFQTEYRRFYRLEDLWADAPRTTYTDERTIPQQS
jgi:ribosome-associated protein